MSGFAKAYAHVLKDIDGKVFEHLRDKFASGEHQVNIGFPDNGKKHKGEGLDATTVAQVAAFNEFGTATNPERSFLRTGIQTNRYKYIKLNRENLLKILAGKLTFEKALGILGEVAKADVQANIVDGNFTPLAPATIKAKGSSKPLIDIGQMRQSVQWELDK